MTPEAVGDYVAGPNHVLPTGRRARFASGLSVLDFMKRTSFISLGDGALDAIGPAAIALAEAEGLSAHARSIELRLNRKAMTNAQARSAARLAAVQALYQHEMEATEIPRLLHEFHQHRLGAEIEDDHYAEADIDFFNDIVQGTRRGSRRSTRRSSASSPAAGRSPGSTGPCTRFFAPGPTNCSPAPTCRWRGDQRISRRRSCVLRCARGEIRQRPARCHREGCACEISKSPPCREAMGRWQRERADGGALVLRLSPPTTCFASGPPPHGCATGRIRTVSFIPHRYDLNPQHVRSRFHYPLRALATDPAARGLADDAAEWQGLVLTHDMIVEGVHLLREHVRTTSRGSWCDQPVGSGRQGRGAARRAVGYSLGERWTRPSSRACARCWRSMRCPCWEVTPSAAQRPTPTA